MLHYLLINKCYLLVFFIDFSLFSPRQMDCKFFPPTYLILVANRSFLLKGIYVLYTLNILL